MRIVFDGGVVDADLASLSQILHYTISINSHYGPGTYTALSSSTSSSLTRRFRSIFSFLAFQKDDNPTPSPQKTHSNTSLVFSNEQFIRPLMTFGFIF